MTHRVLWGFNDRDLANAIVHSRAPVLTAIGHRQDETLADLVADARAHTPSLVGPSLAQAQPQEQSETPAVAWQETRDVPAAKDWAEKQGATPAMEQSKGPDPIWVAVLVIAVILALIVIARVLGWL